MDSKERNHGSNPKETGASKKSVKLPLIIIVPAVIVIAVVVVLSIFVLHLGSSAPSVSYTPVTAFSPSSLASIIGGNWTLAYNKTVNSTFVKAQATSFPPGTISANVQEFIPSSEISALKSNSTSKGPSQAFSSDVFYLNSSSSAKLVFSYIQQSVSAQYGNNTGIKFNTSSVGSSSMVYVNGLLNATNNTPEKISYAYIVNGKDFILDTAINSSFTYKNAESMATYPFSGSLA